MKKLPLFPLCYLSSVPSREERVSDPSLHPLTLSTAHLGQRSAEFRDDIFPVAQGWAQSSTGSKAALIQ